MNKVWATLRTLGILLALWIILAAVGLIAGVVPLSFLDPTPSDATSEAMPTDASADAGVDAVDGGSADESDLAALVDAGVADPERADPERAEPAREPPLRWIVCAGGAEPSLSALQLFGDARPELVVGCGDRWEVIAVGPSGPSRIATFHAPAAPTGERARTGEAASGDVNGDGTIDIVLPLAFETEQGASRGGGLYWIARDGFGGIREPVALAPFAAVSAAVAPLDGSVGAEVVAMTRANPLAQLASETWIFNGGASPSRRGIIRAGLDGLTVDIADIDRDGHDDIISLGRNRVGLAFGDGRGHFTRTHTFTLEGAREIALGDLDRDGGVDLAVLGDGLRWVPAGPHAEMTPRDVEGAPAALRGLSIADVDEDGRMDFVGWDHPSLVVLRQGDEQAFALDITLTLVGGTFGPRRHRLADLDGDGRADDLVLLGTSGDGASTELMLILDAFGAGELSPAPEARPLPDAPLMLQAPLPPS